MKVFLSSLLVVILVSGVLCDDEPGCADKCKAVCAKAAAVCGQLPDTSQCDAALTKCNGLCDSSCACLGTCVTESNCAPAEDAGLADKVKAKVCLEKCKAKCGITTYTALVSSLYKGIVSDVQNILSCFKGDGSS